MSEHQMRYSDSELALIRNTFKDNPDLLKLIRKAFLPELSPDAPIGQNFDLWMTLKIDDMSPEQALINLKARNSLINHLEVCLLELKVLAETTNLTPEEAVTKLKKDSAK